MYHTYRITEIELQSFPEDCPWRPTREDLLTLPADYVLDNGGDYAREDAAKVGVLAHSPYCPDCYPEE